MKIIAIDPGLKHQCMTLTEWSGDHDVKLLHAAAVRTCGRKTLSMDAALETMRGARTRVVPLLTDWLGGRLDIPVIIESQHTKEIKAKKDDIRDLGWAAGALTSAIHNHLPGVTIEIAPTDGTSVRGTHQWSKWSKKVRHNFFRDKLWPDLAAYLEDKWSPREAGDLLDTIGMAYWFYLGKPRGGV